MSSVSSKCMKAAMYLRVRMHSLGKLSSDIFVVVLFSTMLVNQECIFNK